MSEKEKEKGKTAEPASMKFAGKPKKLNVTMLMGAVQRRLEGLYPYMKGHWQKVAFESAVIGEELGLGAEEIEQVRVCAYLMDIGMTDYSISSVLADCTKTGTDYMGSDVRRATELHPVIGAAKLEKLGFPREIVLGVRHHHEWYGGWGYPDGLSGKAIPLISRCLAVADTFVALGEERPFRAACTTPEALEEILSYSPVQFDPEVVEALERVVAKRVQDTETFIEKTIDFPIQGANS